MKHLFAFLKNTHYSSSKKILATNTHAVESSNLMVLKNISIALSIIMTFLLILCFFFQKLSSLYLFFAIMSFFGLGVFAFCQFFGKKELSVIPLFYILFFGVFLFSLFDAIFLSQGEGSAVGFCGLLLIEALVTLDKPVRLNILFVTEFVIFAFCAFFYQESQLYQRDIANAAVFTILAFFVGGEARYLRLQNIEAMRVLELERNYDMLTGLQNRRRLFESLARAEKSSHFSFSGALMLDIDDFKNFNDTYGHQAGDSCLKKLGQFFSMFAEDYGVSFFRYGGEEFLLLAQNIDEKQLSEIGLSLVQGVKNLAIPYESTCVTVSVGFAFLKSKDAIQYEKLIKKADIALYFAKKHGKNRVIKYEEGMNIISSIY